MCAIFAIVNIENAARLTAIGLHDLQHRAIDYAGMVSFDQTGRRHAKRGNGLARQVFTESALAELPGNSALGHLRYPTVADDRTRENIQPVCGMYGITPFAVAHNGNITNTAELAETIRSPRLTTSMDTEYIVRLIENLHTDEGNLEDDLATALGCLQGSFALGILMPDRLIAVRDPHGNRPLFVARINGGHCLSSESCAFANLGAVNAFEVQAGTMVSIGQNGVRTQRFAPASEKKCRFEDIYYAHPSSDDGEESVARFRIRLGRALAEHCPVPGGADLVTPIPDSSDFIAKGYADDGRHGEELKVIVRSHYVGRTFIAATQAKRDEEVTQKFAFTAREIRGKRIVLVDDSIVRCTTLPRIVSVLRGLGAAAIHVRIGSPPIKHPCRYGINTPSETELISSSHSPDEICARVGADSLQFLPLAALKGLSPRPESFCFACMDGKYWDAN